MTKGEIDRMAEMIVRTHNGQMMYNLGEVCKILGQSRSSISGYLHEAGITVLKVGQEKLLNAVQVAEFMCRDRVAPIDKYARGVKRPGGRASGWS